jgi:hypothetical protein
MGKTLKKTIERILNESQNKMIAFHGSNTFFDQFDEKKIGANYKKDKYGFFFTSDFDEAKFAANAAAKNRGGTPIVYTCELYFDNPYTLRDLASDVGDEEMRRIYDESDKTGWDIFDNNREYIIERCFALKKDSVVLTTYGIKFIMVLDKSQIKILEKQRFEIAYSALDAYKQSKKNKHAN